MVLFISNKRGSARASALSFRRRDSISAKPEDFLVLIAYRFLTTKSLEIGVKVNFT